MITAELVDIIIWDKVKLGSNGRCKSFKASF